MPSFLNSPARILSDASIASVAFAAASFNVSANNFCSSSVSLFQTCGAICVVSPSTMRTASKPAIAVTNPVVAATMLQAMHWVSAYKDQFNIRVLNLSWGTSSTQGPAVDPLNYAVQQAWRSGITATPSRSANHR